MATEAQINAVVGAVVASFGGDVALFQTFLMRAKLETEAAALQSAIRKAQTERDADVTNAEITIQDLQAQYQVKIAEIDNL